MSPAGSAGNGRESLHGLGWPGMARLADCGLAPMDVQYAALELARPPGYYIARIRQTELTGRRRVLDAGCGVGHWSAVLAGANTVVLAIDPSPARLRAARLIVEANHLPNVRFVCASAEDLPFRDETFEAVICYGVLMFVRPQRTLRQFAAALARGGRLYLVANGPAWYLIDLPRRSLTGRSPWPLVWSAGYLARTVWRRVSACDLRYTCFTRGELRRLLTRLGFLVRAVGPEGTTGISSGVASAYPTRPLRLSGVLEVLADKK